MAFPPTYRSLLVGLAGCSSVALWPLGVGAQIVPDSTLGVESSVVTPDAIVRGAPADLIQGGALRGQNLFHSFQDFNVAELQRVYFANPQGVTSILSRVTGGNPSQILGTLGVDGGANLFLLNSRGVLFGPNAQLDITGSFTATTGDRFTFLDGSEFSASNPGPAPLVTVNITPGVQLGDIPQGDILNAANLEVGAGQTLTLLGDTVVSSGSLTTPGGTVQVLGNQVNLIDQATIDVSSATGGGNVFVGGEYLGQGSLPTAQQTVVEAGVTINADALTSGDGGTVIVWADNTTEFAGRISARGGALSGNGGFVETSGAQTLRVAPTARVDTTAANGHWGLWLLDPDNLMVQDVGDATIAGGTNSPPDESTISAATIVTALETTAVLLQATNSITVGEVIDASAHANTLTFQAPTLTLNRNVLTGGGQIYDGNVVVGGANIVLTSDTGSVTFNGAVDSVASQANNLTVNSSGPISFSDPIGAAANGALGNLALTSLTGTVSLANSLSIDGNLDIFAGAGDITDNGAWTVGGDARFTTTQPNANITLDQVNTTGTVSLNTTGANGDVTFSANAVNLAASTIGGALNVISTAGNIIDSGAVAVGGDASFTTTQVDADITLNQVNATGPVSLNTTGPNGNATFESDAVTLGTSNVDGELTVTATVGDITLTALTITTGSNQSFNGPIRLSGDAQLTSNNGNITFNNAIDGAHALTVNAANGDVQFTNDIGSLTALTDLTVVTGGAIALPSITTGTLDITSQTGTITQANGSTINTTGSATFTTNLPNSGDVILRNDTPLLTLGNSQVGGNLTLTSNTVTQVAGTSLDVAGALNVSAVDDFSGLSNGIFSLFNLDPTNGNVVISRPGEINLSDDLNDLGVPLIGGAYQVAGNLTVQATVGNGFVVNYSGTEAITLNQAGNTFGGPVSVNTPIPAAVPIDPSIVQGANAVDVSGTTILNANTGDITVNNGSNRLNDSLRLQGNNATVIVNNAVELDTVALTGNLSLVATGAVTGASLINVGGNVDLSTNGGNADIALDQLNVTGIVTVATTGANSSATLTAPTAITLGAVSLTGALDVTAPGGVTLTNNINTGTGQTYSGVVTLDVANPVLASGNGDINFNNAINSLAGAFNSLTAVANNGNLRFGDGVGTGAGGSLDTLNATASGDIQLNGTVQTRDGQNYNGTVVLENNTTVTSTDGAIAFNGNINADTDGGQNLTVNANTGGVAFGATANNVIGGTNQRLAALTVTGAATVNAAAVTTTGNQTYNDLVAVVNNATLTSENGTLIFNDTLSTTGNLVLSATEINFAGNVSTPNNSNLTLQPSDPAQGITVGGDDNDPRLNINAADLIDIQLGFGLLTIGRSDGTGPVTINTSPLDTFNNDVAILGGDITISDAAFIRPVGRNILISGDSVSGQNFRIDPLGLNTGSTTIRARNDIEFTNGLIYGDSLVGNLSGGDVSIISETGNVILNNQDIISVNAGSGPGGSIIVRANQGTVNIDNGSRLTTTAQGPGSGGNIAISGATVEVAGNSSITSGTGQLFDLAPVLSANGTGGTGTSGNITLSATGNLTLTDSFVSSITRSTDATIAGNISVGGQNITLDNSSITAETSDNNPRAFFVTSTGRLGQAVEGGNITITGRGTSNLTLRNDSLISARGIQARILPSGLLDTGTPNNPTAVATDNPLVAGGNIFIRGFAQVIGEAPGVRGNDILTSTGGSFGGMIIIDPTILSGFTIGPSTDFNDLRSNNVNNIATNGEIITLNLSLLLSTSEIDINFIDAAGLVGDACARSSQASYFTVGGRGGIPLDPTGALFPAAPQQGWIFLEDADTIPGSGLEDRSAIASVGTASGRSPHGVCYQGWQAQQRSERL